MVSLKNFPRRSFHFLKSGTMISFGPKKKMSTGKWWKLTKMWHLFPVAGFVIGVGYHQYKLFTNPVSCDGHICDDGSDPLHKLKETILKVKDENGSPGVVVSVSVDGRNVWTEGFGYANLESRIHCNAETVMRVASISKAITTAVVAKLWEEGKLDLDKPVTEYVKQWPEKTFNQKQVTITTRQLVSHLSGLRHYDKTCGEKLAKLKEAKNQKNEDNKDASEREKQRIKELEDKEFLSKKHFSSVVAALDMFKADRLCSHPGTQYLYTTHGWTLVSAVVEAASGKKFRVLTKELFSELGLQATYLDLHDPLIYNRASFYVKNKQGRVQNAPYVDNSYKFAGGGFLSTATDLVKFGNAMLYSYQSPESDKDISPNRVVGSIANADNQGLDTKGGSSNSRSGDQGCKSSVLKYSNHHGNGGQTSQGASYLKTISQTSNSDSNKGIEQSQRDDLSDVIRSGDNQGRPVQYLKPGYLKASTVRMLWSPVALTKTNWDSDGGSYGMGWAVMPAIEKYGCAKRRPFYVSHTGAATGASSVLLIMPTDKGEDMASLDGGGRATGCTDASIAIPPKGIVVAIIANMQGINLNPAALEIANKIDKEFKEM